MSLGAKSTFDVASKLSALSLTEGAPDLTDRNVRFPPLWSTANPRSIDRVRAFVKAVREGRIRATVES